MCEIGSVLDVGCVPESTNTGTRIEQVVDGRQNVDAAIVETSSAAAPAPCKPVDASVHDERCRCVCGCFEAAKVCMSAALRASQLSPDDGRLPKDPTWLSLPDPSLI